MGEILAGSAAFYFEAVLAKKLPGWCIGAKKIETAGHPGDGSNSFGIL